MALLCMAPVAVSGCDDASEPAPSPAPVALEWRRVDLPAASGRPAPRDAVVCGGRWYVVGALVAADGETSPAVWTSQDAVSWSSVRLEPLSYYGERAIMYSVGCRDGVIAAVGAKSGGAHGNPRVSTWYQRPDGALREVTAYFELYGGNTAVGVSHVVGGPAGWLIAGNRTSGAAVWLSPDATEFTLVEGAPNLATDSSARTTAADAIAVAPGWLVVGGDLRSGRIDHDPAVWTSTDGRGWTRTTMPATDLNEVLFRVVQIDADLLAVGVRGDAFGAWRRRDGSWQAAGTFGTAGGSIVAGVTGAAVAAGRILVSTEAAAGRHVWISDPSGQRWSAVQTPVEVRGGGDTALSVAASGSTVLLLTDDGRSGTVWLTRPAP
jgi:hypothetical protein